MPQSQQPKKQKIKYRLLRYGLWSLIIILAAIVTIIPGALRLLHRADAQVALGHAKSVRLALQVTGQENYGIGDSFTDASQMGGVDESVYTSVMTLSKAPGEFWVLNVAEDGYTVTRFIYREDEYTVWYNSDPKSYEVYYNQQMIGSDTPEQNQ